MATIPRNHTHKIAGIREQMTACRVYSLDNQFAGQDIEPRHAWEALTRYRHANLSEREPGRKYVVHVPPTSGTS
jgi:hypothetical protein